MTQAWCGFDARMESKSHGALVAPDVGPAGPLFVVPDGRRTILMSGACCWPITTARYLASVQWCGWTRPLATDGFFFGATCLITSKYEPWGRTG